MRYTLLIRPEAELDIEDAFEWYEIQKIGLGSELIRSVDSCFSNIGRNPLAYPIIHKQARRALVHRFPYSIIYVSNLNVISIIACFHSKRSPKQWQDRL